MRTLWLISGILLTLRLSAHPNVRSGSLPGWLYDNHPRLNERPSVEDISNGYYYDLLDFQSNLARNTEFTHYIRHIVNGSGVQYASEVSVTFSPQFQHVVFHRIDIIRDGMVIHRLRTSRIKVVQEETDADEFQYNGLKRAFLTLDDVRKGDRIDVAFSVVGFNPVFGNKYSDEFSLSSETAVCNYFKTIITTTDRPLFFRTTNHAPGPVEHRHDKTLIYTWDNPSIDADDTRSGSNIPSWFNSYPTVYVTEFEGWPSVVDWGLKTFNHYKYPLPPALQQKVSDWKTRSQGDKVAFASLALRFVQDEIRYLGLEIGTNTHRPHPPTAVFERRFGDCKDKALLLTAILRHEDIPAYVALINTETRSRLNTVAPSPGAFDHAIVAIRRPDGKYDFIDPTLTAQRGQFADLFLPAYGYALVLREGESGLQPVTPGKINDYSIIETLDAPWYDSSHLSVTSVYTGAAADDIRSMFSEKSTKDLEAIYRKYYATISDEVRQDRAFAFTDDSEKNMVTVRKHYCMPPLWKTGSNGGRYFEFTVRILEQNLPDPSDAPDNVPIALPYPFNVHYTLDLNLPESWSFDELHIKNDAYQFDFEPVRVGNNISLHYSLRTFDDHIPAASVGAYKQDYKNIYEKISFRLTRAPDAGGSFGERNPSPDATAPAHLSLGDWKACWPAIWLTFFFSLLFFRLFQYLNTRSEETLYAAGSGYPLGGWLILLGISIASVLVLEVTRLLQAGYFSDTSWEVYGNAGGISLQYLYLTQLAIQLTLISGAAILLFWFIKKRDIFPRMFLWYAGILLSGRLLLLVLFYVMPIPASIVGYRSVLILALVRSAVCTIAWAGYILRSGQVKSTFLEPFRQRIR
ncbi:MAG TPA: DUF3857 domain-containing protein [Puia sp.]|nr:DUF3857 domain-containing protein [Puia sp.]